MIENQNGRSTTSGWEKADKVASGIGTVASGIGWMIVKAYALGLIAIGIVVCVALGGGSAVAGIAISLYGLYLLFGGRWIIY